jgi:hypothetical protein
MFEFLKAIALLCMAPFLLLFLHKESEQCENASVNKGMVAPNPITQQQFDETNKQIKAYLLKKRTNNAVDETSNLR